MHDAIDSDKEKLKTKISSKIEELPTDSETKERGKTL